MRKYLTRLSKNQFLTYKKLRFDVSSMESYGHQMDVETALCPLKVVENERKIPLYKLSILN